MEVLGVDKAIGSRKNGAPGVVVDNIDDGLQGWIVWVHCFTSAAVMALGVV